jgi:NAD(P)-dependent dehydrogenase (short-subunit alcohol dehydrogenase family)
VFSNCAEGVCLKGGREKLRLKDKSAIVTGAAAGIGRAIALLFAKEGATVTVADMNQDGGLETVRLIRELGRDALFCRVDVSDSSEVRNMMQKTVKRTGKINILVNNAAHMKDFGTAVDTTEDQWDRSIDVTLKGAFLCSKFAIPDMMKIGGGSIINIASVGGAVGFASYVAYCCAKGGIVQLTKSLAIDYGPFNIRVNAISPGAIDTAASPKGKDEKTYQYQISMSVLGRTGQPEEVAFAALFLASDESSFISGSNLFVDGGWTVR